MRYLKKKEKISIFQQHLQSEAIICLKNNFLNLSFNSKLTKILINFTASVEDNIEMINLINE